MLVNDPAAAPRRLAVGRDGLRQLAARSTGTLALMAGTLTKICDSIPIPPPVTPNCPIRRKRISKNAGPAIPRLTNS